MSGWINALERLPAKEEVGGFGVVEVITQCDRDPARGDEPWQTMRLARPTFIGRRAGRVLWVTAEDKSSTPIEDSAWFVSHWRPFPKFPKPLPAPRVGSPS